MPGQLIISVSPWDVRAALVEDGRLAELHVERLGRLDPTGNVYLGRVQKVIPGMAAAFVDIGLDQPGYLFIDRTRPPRWPARMRSGPGGTRKNPGRGPPVPPSRTWWPRARNCWSRCGGRP